MIHMQGKSVVLRDWEIGDLEPLARWHTGEQEWKLWDGPYFPQLTEAERDAWISRMRERIEQENFPFPRNGMCVADRDSNAMVGGVSSYWQIRESNWLSVGITLYDPKLRGRGLGYEALGMWCEYLFCGMEPLSRLDLRTWSGNIQMVKLAEKLGFQEEARFRMAHTVREKSYDGLGFGVLREEWEARYPKGFGEELGTRG
jgi:putative hydrolase of HD superfamily